MIALPNYGYDVQGLPAGSTRKPLMLFLHGRGERGFDISRVRTHGPPRLFPRFGLERFVVLAPQCPAEQSWDEVRLEEFLRQAIRAYPVDEKRIYLTGISMGGFGGWALGTRCAELFAAIALICGGGQPARADSLVGDDSAIPVWLFHSAADPLVPVSGSDALFDALRQLNGNVTYTRYRALDHVGTWEHAYATNTLYDWFLRQ